MATILSLQPPENNFFTPLLRRFGRAKPKRNDQWYHQLKAHKDFNELAIQGIILEKLKALVPDFFAILYGRTIRSTDPLLKPRIPDFLIWDKKYTAWYIVEAELEGNDEPVVDAQLKTFYTGDYTDIDDIAEYVRAKAPPGFDISAFKSMISRSRPRLILMSDHIHCDWRKKFDKYKCMYSTLQVYSDENTRDKFIYRFGGELPQQAVKSTYCRIITGLRTLELNTPGFLASKGHLNGDTINLLYLNEQFEWEVNIDQSGREELVYLENFLSIDLTIRRWRIIMNTKGELHLSK